MTLLLLPMLFCATLPADAPAESCVKKAGSVVCGESAFDDLIEMLVDNKQAAAACKLTLADCADDRVALRAALAVKATPAVVTPEKPSALRPVLALTGAVISTALITIAPFIPVADVRWKWVTATAGAVGLGLSYVFVIP